ncbi:sensor histidine kinase [Streptomyces sp. SID13666]|uniref:anti-sigma factor RsbA family regulatory protein n=1 Tax=Streptomyces sp. SID13666 TaxID=2706054 RepID=UPI0013BED5E5|nr:anti-sigma factor RsbA family regulatory protein [Streptomyces sp. SID13666]NEA58722.1 sensor histidine kinase [Streptomyces sp. SID13666]
MSAIPQDTTRRGEFAHPALLYRGSDAYLAGTVPFITEGLDRGEPVAVAVPGPNLALLEKALDDRAGEVSLLDMTRAGRNPGRIIPGVLRAFADAHPGRRVRIIGEPIWQGRSATEYPACVQHEALINLAFADRDVTILCPYDVDGLSPDVLADAAATHPVLIDDAGSVRSPDYAPTYIVAKWNLPLPEAPDGALTLAFDNATLTEPRLAASRYAVGAGLDLGRIPDVELAVNELATNTILHGGGSGTLRLWTEDGHLVCELRDRGHLTDPLVGRIPVVRATPGGRGMLLVNHLADLVRMHTTAAGTTLRVYFALTA